jgi:hypothetical protein
MNTFGGSLFFLTPQAIGLNAHKRTPDVTIIGRVGCQQKPQSDDLYTSKTPDKKRKAFKIKG